MDELTRAASALRERDELAPTPLPEIEYRTRRRRRRHQVTGLVVVLVVGIGTAIGVAANATRSSSRPNHVFVGPPPNGATETTSVTTTPPSTVAPTTSPVTTAKPTRPSALYTPPASSYTAGSFAVTTYNLTNAAATWGAPMSTTVTKSAIFYSNPHGIVRVDPATGAVTGRFAMEGGTGTGDITSTENTVYALDTRYAPDISVVAIDANTLKERWTSLIGTFPDGVVGANITYAVGKNVIWVALPSAGQGQLRSFDLSTGKYVATIDLAAEPTGLVATPTFVYVGGQHSMTKVNIAAPTPEFTTMTEAGAFEPYALYGGGIWGRLTHDGTHTTELVQVSPTDGSVLHTIGVTPNGFYPVGDGTAWVTTDTGAFSIIDTATGAELQHATLRTVMNNAPADVHLLNGTGWAVNAFANQLVRITRR